MSFPYLLSALAALMLTASCSKAIEKRAFSKKSGINSDAGVDYTQTSSIAPEILEAPSEIQLVNSKFAGEEGKLEATVTFGGSTSARLKLTASDGIASLSVSALAADRTDTLVVDIYEGQKLRFRAHRANTTVEKDQANSWKIEDCSISKLPWDGETNETTCGWSVQDNQ